MNIADTRNAFGNISLGARTKSEHQARACAPYLKWCNRIKPYTCSSQARDHFVDPEPRRKKTRQMQAGDGWQGGYYRKEAVEGLQKDFLAVEVHVLHVSDMTRQVAFVNEIGDDALFTGSGMPIRHPFGRQEGPVQIWWWHDEPKS